MSKLDDLELPNLKNKLLNDFNETTRLKFADDFEGAADETLELLDNKTNILDYWSNNKAIYSEQRLYPEGSNIDWNTARSNVLSNGTDTEKKVLLALEERFASPPPPHPII